MPTSEFPTEIENYLIVGSDSRDGANPDDPDYMGIVGTENHVGRRSDTIMILRFDPVDQQRRRSLSLPRDLYVDIPGSDDKNRINAAFFKGPDVLIKTITESLRHPRPPLRRGRLPGLQAHRRRHRRRVDLVRRARRATPTPACG